MSLRDQVLAQAMLLAGDLSERQQIVLGALCTASTASLNARLREGLTAEDCKADFIASASLLALAAMASVSEDVPVEQITVGFLREKGEDHLRCGFQLSACTGGTDDDTLPEGQFLLCGGVICSR